MAEVTVVIPSFDRAALLPRAVASVLAQKGADWELVIVDDGSTDATLKTLERYRGDARITVLARAHAGVSVARNAGAAAGTAPWIAFLDSDDEWLPGKLEAQLRNLRDTGLRIAQTEEMWIRNGVRVNPPNHLRKRAGDIFAVCLERCMITPSSVMIARDLWDATGGFRPDFPACEDYEMWLRIAARHPVGLLPSLLLRRYGGHADQLSARHPALDRFRIRAIALLLDGNDLTQAQRGLALAAMGRKLDIYRQGGAKRGRDEEVAWCDGIRSKYLQGAAGIPAAPLPADG